MEDIVFIVGFFTTAITMAFGIPLLRSYIRRKEKEPTIADAQLEKRLGQMTTTLDAMSLEIERISENQRFLTKLLAEREQVKAALPADRS